MSKTLLYSFTLLLLPFFYIQGQPVLPLKHEKSFYRDTSGKLFAPGSLPIFLSISHNRSSTNPQLLETSSEKVYLKEGLNIITLPTTYTIPDSLQTVKTNYEITSDATPPISKIKLSNAIQYNVNKTDFYGKGLNIDIIGDDKLSGLNNTYISVNGSVYKPLNEIYWNLEDNKYTIYYYSVDHVGNAEAPQLIEFYSDIHAPETKIELSWKQNNFILPSGTFIELNGTDNLSGIKNIFFEIDNQGKQLYTKSFMIANLSNNEHELQWFSEDNVGNIEEKQIFRFYYDTIAPEVMIVIEGNKYQKESNVFVGQNVQISFTASDNKAEVAKIEYSFDSKGFNVYNEVFSLPNVGGLYRVKYTATDRVNNKSNEFTQKVYVDLTPPETFCKYSKTTFWEKDTILFTAGTTVELTATDLESGLNNIQYSINDSLSIVYREQLTFNEPGLFKLKYFALDNVQNKEQERTLWIKLNKTSQQTEQNQIQYAFDWIKTSKGQLTGAKGGAFFLKISESPSDSATKYLVFVDKDNILEELKFLVHGKNNLKMNIGDKKFTFPISIDGQAPTTHIQFKGAVKSVQNKTTYYGGGLKVGIHANDNTDESRSGVAGIYFSMNSPSFREYKETLDLFSMEQDYNLKYYAIDSVKNMTSIFEEKFVIDITPPYTTPEFARGVLGNIISSNSIIRLNTTDNLSGVKKVVYWFDSGNEIEYNQSIAPTAIEKLKEGEHKLSYYATDHVNNKENTRTLNFIVDHTVPDVQMTINGNKFFKGNVWYLTSNSTISLKATELITGIKFLRYQFLGENYKDYDSEINVPKQFGNLTFNYTCADEVDNTVTKAFSVFVDDLTPNTSLSFIGPEFNDMGVKYICYNTKIILSANDQGSGINQIYYQINNGSILNYKQAIQIKESGNFVFNYYSVDNLNNQEKPQQVSFVVDNISPVLKIMFSADGAEINPAISHTISPYSFIHVASDDNVSLEGIFYSINNEELQVYRKPISNFEHGKTMVFKAVSIDRVGNKTEKTIKFIVE